MQKRTFWYFSDLGEYFIFYENEFFFIFSIPRIYLTL